MSTPFGAGGLEAAALSTELPSLVDLRNALAVLAFSPGPSHTAPPGKGTDVEALLWICDETQLHADTDGDGNLDEVAAWSPATGCDAPEVGERYVLHVSSNKIPVDTGSPSPLLYRIDQPLPGCDQPFACLLFAAPDIDRDGRAELAVAFKQEGSTMFLTLYRVELDPAHDRYALVRIGMAAPGDLWKSGFDLVPGPAAFAWGGSAGERHTESCGEQEGKRVLVVTTLLPSEQLPGAYDVHQTVLRPSQDELIVVRTNDQMMSEIQPPMPNQLCGAPINGIGLLTKRSQLDSRDTWVMPSGRTLLVDSASLIYRALFSVPDTVKAPDGTPMNAAYGFLGMLEGLVSTHDPDFICCAADDDWRPDWRVELIDTYKTYRAEPGSAQEQAEDRLAPQMPVIFEILAGCGIQVVGHPGYEAEDVIGTLAQRAPGRVGIVSSDRDLFQLVRDPDVFVLYPRRGVSEVDVVDQAYIEAKYQIPGRAYRDFAVLRGDPSDGLPGVRGVGPKLAAGLLARYGSLDAILEAARGSDDQGIALSKVRRDLDYVERAVKVVTIPTDLPIREVDLARPRREPDATVVSLAEQHALAGALRRLVAALQSGRAGT